LIYAVKNGSPGFIKLVHPVPKVKSSKVHNSLIQTRLFEILYGFCQLAKSWNNNPAIELAFLKN
jgi:hypothetical protein